MKNILLSSLSVALFAVTSIYAEPFTQDGEATQSAAPPTATLVSANAEDLDGTLTITVESVDPDITPWTHVFLDTDGEETGFQHASNVAAGKGLDILLEGNIAYRFSGEDPTAWNWKQIPDVVVERSISGNTLTVSLPVAALELTKDSALKGFIATYVEDYASTLDTLPREDKKWKISLTSSDKSAAIEMEKPLPARTDARDAFKKIRSYSCYYGSGHSADLLARDASIIETKAQTPADVNALRKTGHLAIGYISIGEDDDFRIGDGKGPGGYDSAYFDRNEDGKADKNVTWNSTYANASSPAWRKHFLEKAQAMVDSHGVDGFFLDTIETCLLYPESYDGMVSLIKELREAHPDKIIVMNRGWDLLPDLEKIPDGLMFESFTLSYDFGDKKYVTMRPSAWDHGLEIWERLIRPAQKSYGLVPLALDYAESADAENIPLALDRAATLGFIPCITTINLDAFYNIDHKATPDDRWLARQETAESRKLTLKKASNGFPAGAVINPSSNYPDYSVKAIVDGIASGESKQNLGWRERAWASMEQPGEHSLEITLPKPTEAKSVEIAWAWDAGKTFPAKNFRVEVQPAGVVGQWATVTHVEDNSKPTNNIALPEGEFTGLRIVQASAGGAKLRPNLMWVEQVKLLP
ncbi:MAG: hypothetical protein ACK5LK_08090 [Chthoniobacterales bacterium]